MKHLLDMPGQVETRRARRQFPFAQRLSAGEVAAVRRQFDLVPVVSNDMELVRLRARLETCPDSMKADCWKALSSLALTQFNQAKKTLSADIAD